MWQRLNEGRVTETGGLEQMDDVVGRNEEWYMVRILSGFEGGPYYFLGLINKIN